MKKYGRVFRYLRDYKEQVMLYFLFIVLSIVFSIVSLGMLMPFLDLIFKGEQSGTSDLISQTSNPVVRAFKNFLFSQISQSGSGIEGKSRALGIICGLIIVSILFKNLFLYFALYILNPLKNKVVNRLRSALYDKILHLPIGFFTEKRKGDLISRITNDMGEVDSQSYCAVHYQPTAYHFCSIDHTCCGLHYRQGFPLSKEAFFRGSYSLRRFSFCFR
jgi:subfamily B ATP-binding cassette protein MsbA